MNDQLEKLGFDPQLLDDIDPSIPGSCVPARVTQVHKESYFVTNGEREVYAEVTGKLLFSVDSPLDLPVTGDWCLTQFLDDEKLAIIHLIFPRQTMLKRKTPGKKTEFQPIASNIDIAFLVQALDDDFSLRRLERYLVMTLEGGIEPVVLLSKADLVTRVELMESLRSVREVAGESKIIGYSAETGAGIDEIARILKPGLTCCLLGSSGVGKSTLLNRLAGKQLMETREIREKDGKGRHTTTSRQLLILDSGVMVIDTPGMRELGNIGAGEGLGAAFSEIDDLEGFCRFSDCTHRHEDGCAILAAVGEGKILPERYESYLKMLKENAFNERTYLDKRRRDKEFGKLYKSVQRNNKKR